MIRKGPDRTNPAVGRSLGERLSRVEVSGSQPIWADVTTFDVDGRVNLANKMMERVFKFEEKRDRSTYQLRVNLSALTCLQFDETFRYGYRCSVRNADLRAAPAR